MIILVECSKGSIVTFSHGLYTEFTHYCEILGTNVFPIRQHSPKICQHSSLFATFCHYSQLFATICDYSGLFVTVCHYSSLFATIYHYSSLFATIRTIHDYSLFAIWVFLTPFLQSSALPVSIHKAAKRPLFAG